jgi:hypothetical protein
MYLFSNLKYSNGQINRSSPHTKPIAFVVIVTLVEKNYMYWLKVPVARLSSRLS